MVKRLVYCCVFYNKDYFKLLGLLLKSMIVFSRRDTFDFLVMTQESFLPYIKELENELNIKLSTFCIPCATIFQAACARLAIFNYPMIHEYTKILYLDTDIIIKQDITPILDLEIEEVLYAIESGTIESPSFGSYFFDFSTIDKSVSGLNSGTLLFKNCEAIQSLFSRMLSHIDEYTKAGYPMLYCMDQPFINYHAIKDKLYNNQLINPYVSLYENVDTVSNYETSSVCHFSYPIGNFTHKYHRMAQFLRKLLTGNTITNDTTTLVGKKYSWGPKGFIHFKKDRLVTTWSENGFYTFKSLNLVEAVWNNHYHTLLFNSDYTQYISIRTSPIDFSIETGVLLSDS